MHGESTRLPFLQGQFPANLIPSTSRSASLYVHAALPLRFSSRRSAVRTCLLRTKSKFSKSVFTKIHGHRSCRIRYDRSTSIIRASMYSTTFIVTFHFQVSNAFVDIFSTSQTHEDPRPAATGNRERLDDVPAVSVRWTGARSSAARLSRMTRPWAVRSNGLLTYRKR